MRLKNRLLFAGVGVALAGLGLPAAAATRQQQARGGLFTVTYEATGGSERYQNDTFGDNFCFEGNQQVPGSFSDSTTASATGLSWRNTWKGVRLPAGATGRASASAVPRFGGAWPPSCGPVVVL